MTCCIIPINLYKINPFGTSLLLVRLRLRSDNNREQRVEKKRLFPELVEGLPFPVEQKHPRTPRVFLLFAQFRLKPLAAVAEEVSDYLLG